MASSADEIEKSLEEIERALKRLSKIKSTQVRSGEHRDFFKATSLAWFRNHRPILAATVSADLIAEIDASYNAMLSATDRASAKNTYVIAAKNAKNGLIRARSEALTNEGPAVNLHAAPDFSALASDVSMQEILVRRWAECQGCMNAGAPLAATVMMGGLLEALLVARANKLSDKSLLFSCTAAPKDRSSGKPLQLKDWMLAPYIEVGYELKWISRSGKDVAKILQNYRNYIHPEKERANGVSISSDDAAMLWEVVKNLSRELLTMKGAN